MHHTDCTNFHMIKNFHRPSQTPTRFHHHPLRHFAALPHRLWSDAVDGRQYSDCSMSSVLVEPKPVSVQPRRASSTALSPMNNHNASTSSSHHLSVLAKVLNLFRSHSDSSMPRPPSPPRRRTGPSRSSSASPCTASPQQQQVGHFNTSTTL